MFKVKDGNKIITINTPCEECDLNYKGGATKSGPELFKIGWHAHKNGKNGYAVFIDDALFEKYAERYPGGPLMQLVESVDKALKDMVNEKDN